MAKPKIDFKKLMLEKGEKYGLIAGVAIMGLLVVWGIMTAFGSASTKTKSDGMTADAKRYYGKADPAAPAQVAVTTPQPAPRKTVAPAATPVAPKPATVTTSPTF